MPNGKCRMPKVQLADGLILFQSHLPPDEQRELWAMCRALADGPAPMYTPTAPGGKKMSAGMLCLGKHWNGLTYKYHDRQAAVHALPLPRHPPQPPAPPPTPPPPPRPAPTP